MSASLQLDEAPGTRRWRVGVDTLALNRQFHSVTLLPTGEAIVTGGTSLDYRNDADWQAEIPRRRPEIWDPNHVEGDGVGRWYGARAGELQLAEEPVARSHHSSAVLLPDGRVLSGGGQDTHPTAIIHTVGQYSPPYLYRPLAQGGDAAFRPRLYGAQDHVGWGGTFEVACPDPVVAACLIRPGAATHTFNQDQRYDSLGVVSQAGHRVTLHLPANPAEAPPGNYLLFVLAQDPVSGRPVPSIARWVNVGAAQTSYATWDTLPPATVADLRLADVTQVVASLRWTSPADAGVGTPGHASRYELRYRAGQSIATLADFFTHGRRVAGSPTPGAAGATENLNVLGLSPDTVYYFRLLARDHAGSDRNWSALSNELQVQLGGGGCPFVDTETDGGWREENSILGRSLTGAPALDPYRLRHAPAVRDGRIRLRVRENEQELTTLDQVRLIAIDHAPGLKAYALGEQVVLGARVPPRRVTTSAGRDVTALVDGTGAGFQGGPGDTLLVEFAPEPPAGAFGATATQDHDPFLIDDGEKGGGGTPLQWRAPEMLGASAVDAQVLGSTGIRIEARGGDGLWQAVAHRYPREHADEAVFDSPGGGPLRLVFVGRHRLNFAGRLRIDGGTFTARKLPLLAADHSRLGDVRAAIDTLTGAPGNLTSVLAPGDTVSLEFGWTAVPEGQVRELLLLSRGVYTANLPARAQEAAGPPPRFAFHGVRPNPASADAALAFDLPQAAAVRVEVFDVQGRRVARVLDRRLAAGQHLLPWLVRDEHGARLARGLYFLRLRAGSFTAQRSVIVQP